MSVATALVEQVEELARDNNLVNVEEVTIEIGFLRQVVPDIMQNAFKGAVAGTIVSGARLEIREIEAIVQCRRCQHKFTPGIDNFLCPGCQQSDIDIIRGNDIIIASLSGEKNTDKSENN
jgi:hydrogenase nickel incorporation protein HypA/HybF